MQKRSTKICHLYKITFLSLSKIKENVENTSLDKCFILKEAFQKKDNFLVCDLEASAGKLSSLQGTVSVMEQCVEQKETEIDKSA